MTKQEYDLLTPKERACLRASLGRTVDGVATLLSLSPHTVKTHLTNARRKLGGRDRGSAALALVDYEKQHHPLTASPYRAMDDPSPRLDTKGQADPTLGVGLNETPQRFVFDNLSLPDDRLTVAEPAGLPAMMKILLAAGTTLLLSITLVAVHPLAQGFEWLSSQIVPLFKH